MKSYEVILCGRMTGEVDERLTLNNYERARAIFEELLRIHDRSYQVCLIEVSESRNELARQ